MGAAENDGNAAAVVAVGGSDRKRIEWLWRMEMLPLSLLAAMMGRKHWVAVKVEMLPLSLLAAVTGRRHG